MLPEREASPKSRGRRPASPWSFKVATILGIPVRLHFTFFLLFVWIYAVSAGRGMLMFSLLVMGIFACVLLHEFGHALVARRYGIETRDITLYPIGGVASINGRPKPAQELWIALAGPAVNVVIALLLIPVSLLVLGRMPIQPTFFMDIRRITYIDALFAANVFLPLFNMAPAFPMDGGRVLRAFLGMHIGEVRATQIAASIGQFMAIGFGVYGLLNDMPILLLIAFFVFLGAGQEVQATIGYSFIEGRRIRDATQTRFRAIESGAPLERAASMLLEGSQQDFPVVAGDEVAGLLTRVDIARGLATEGPTGYVAGHMRRDFRRLSPDDPLERALELLSEDNAPVLIFDQDRLMGMITSENLSEFMMIEHARQQNSPRPY